MSDVVMVPRKILEQMEWCCGTSFDQCPICTSAKSDGHFNSCPIGTVLKPKEVVPEPTPVQHEITFNGEKYRTVFNDVIGSCYGCDLEAACSLKRVPDDSDWCLSSRNADKKNRVWEKVAV